MIVTREADPTRTHRPPGSGATACPAPTPSPPSLSSTAGKPCEAPSTRVHPSPLHPSAPSHALTATPAPLTRPLLITLGLLSIYLLLASLDRTVFKAAFVGLERIDRLEEADWYRLFRVLGSLWTWAAVALIVFAHDWGKVWRAPDLSLAKRLPNYRWGAMTRGLCIFLAPVVAGLFAEGAKRLVGRLRPIETDGFYAYATSFDALLDPPNGMASSHTAVAFGGMIVLISFFPRSAWVLLPAALGCAYTRIVSGAHFMTDVYLGALLGCAAARVFTPPLVRALDPFRR